MEKIQTADKKVATRESINDDFCLTLGSDYNWEHLLSPAPLGIAVLGNLMYMAGTMKDFAIDDNQPKNATFKHINHPKSFRATLVQISNAGYRAFLSAHVNMDKMRLHAFNVPGYMQQATKLLISNNEQVIKSLVPGQLENISRVAKECCKLSKDVVSNFDDVMDLTFEVIEACTSTKGHKEHIVSEAIKELQTLKTKSEMTKALVEGLESEKKKMEKEIDDANEAVKKAAAESPGLLEIVVADCLVKAADFLTFQFAKTSLQPGNNQQSSGTEQQNEDESLEQLVRHSTHIEDVFIIAKKFKEMLHKMDDKCNLNSVEKKKFNCKNDLKKLEDVSNIATESKELYDACLKGLKLLKKLSQTAVASEEEQKLVLDHLKEHSAEFFRDADRLSKRVLQYRQPIRNRTPCASQATPNSSDGGAVAQAVSAARYKQEAAQERLKMARESAEKTRDLMIQKNQEQIEVLMKMQKLDLDKIDYDEAIKLLHEGLVNLAKLKEHWSKLVIFFNEIATIVQVTMNDSLTNFNQQIEETSKNAQLFLQYNIDNIYTAAMKVFYIKLISLIEYQYF